ncbi:MAG: S8 family peptidase [Phycisphaerales bacterium]
MNRSSLFASIIAALAGTAIAADNGAIVEPGKALTPQQLASLTPSDSVNVFQTTREDLLKLGDPRVKVALDPALMTFTPPAIDKRNFRTIKSADYAPDRIFVRFKPGTTPEQMDAASRVAGKPEILHESCLVNGLYSVRITSMTVPEAVDAYLNHPAVLYAEPQYYSRTQATPNDVLFSTQWAMKTANAGARTVNAWDERTNALFVIVAIVDSGIDVTHGDLAGNLWSNSDEIVGNGIDDDGNGYVDDNRGWDYWDNDNTPDPTCNDHGTLMAGVVGARGNNSSSIAGVCWRVQLMNLRLEAPPSPSCDSLVSAVLATEYAAANGARISNHSYVSSTFSQALFDTFAAVQAAGHIAFAAAGNSTTNNDVTPYYPANYALGNIISVAAMMQDGSRRPSSNVGVNTVDLAAPGDDIVSITFGDSVLATGGTSLAAPHVAGTAALMLATYPSLTFTQVRERILNTVVTSAEWAPLVATGGRLDSHAALGIWLDPTSVVAGNGSFATPYRNFTGAYVTRGNSYMINLKTTTTYPLQPTERTIDRPIILRAPAGVTATVQ